MKKIFACAFLGLTVITTYSQTNVTKKPVKPAIKPATPALQLKTLEDSANYAMGMSVAGFYKQQGFSKINSAIVTKAINDVMSGKPAMLNEMQANNAMMSYLNKEQLVKSKPNIEACENFLGTNKKKQGVVTTASGLQYEVITQGTGPKPTAN